MVFPTASTTRPSPTGTSLVLPARTRAMGWSLDRERLAEPGALPLAQEAGLSDAHLQVIPRKRLGRLPEAPRVEGGIAVPLAQGPAPVAIHARGHFDEVGDTPVAAGQQRLEPRFARVLVHHAHGQPAGAVLDDLELGLQAPRVLEGRPLERRLWFRYEGGHRERELAERVAVGPGHPQPFQHARGEVDHGLDILPRLGRQSDHEIALEVRDRVFPDEIAGRVELLVADHLPRNAA